jgi:DNA-binding NarL/FixJ family response regulator
LPLASLLARPEVNLIWEENIGRGILERALEHMALGKRFVDPACRQSIEAAVAAAGALTHRELEVLALVAAGLSNRQIAERLVVAEVTARDHVQRILRKLAVSDRTAAAVIGMRLGLLS